MVAAHVASQLGWDLLDNQLVDEVANQLGTSRQEVESREERVPSLVQRLADAMAVGTPEMPAPIIDANLPPSDIQLMEVTKRVILKAVAAGPVVLVGRGAQAMLLENTDAIHIFCYAPMEVLAARAAERHGISMDDALKRVHDTNKDRANFVKKHWGRDWMAHHNYHMCVNTDWVGIEGAGDLVVALARQKFAATASR